MPYTAVNIYIMLKNRKIWCAASESESEMQEQNTREYAQIQIFTFSVVHASNLYYIQTFTLVARIPTRTHIHSYTRRAKAHKIESKMLLNPFGRRCRHMRFMHEQMSCAVCALYGTDSLHIYSLLVRFAHTQAHSSRLQNFNKRSIESFIIIISFLAASCYAVWLCALCHRHRYPPSFLISSPLLFSLVPIDASGSLWTNTITNIAFLYVYYDVKCNCTVCTAHGNHHIVSSAEFFSYCDRCKHELSI